MFAKKTKQVGDPALLERLTRALGYRQSQTGEVVAWEDLGRLLGLSKSSMTDLRYARRKLALAEAVKLARFCGVNLAWLADNDGPMESGRPVTGLPEPDIKALKRGESATTPGRGASADLPRRVAGGGLPSSKGAKRGRRS